MPRKIPYQAKPESRYGILKLAILDLRGKFFSYKRIQKELGCSKGTIAYHLGKGQKEKNRLRNVKRRNKIKSNENTCKNTPA